jgi:hypothetical protein
VSVSARVKAKDGWRKHFGNAKAGSRERAILLKGSLLKKFIVLLFICAYNAWVISPLRGSFFKKNHECNSCALKEIWKIGNR